MKVTGCIDAKVLESLPDTVAEALAKLDIQIEGVPYTDPESSWKPPALNMYYSPERNRISLSTHNCANVRITGFEQVDYERYSACIESQGLHYTDRKTGLHIVMGVIGTGELRPSPIMFDDDIRPDEDDFVPQMPL